MDFQVCCECGGSVSVSAGAAGGRVDCPCGRTILVPSLAKLRVQAGLPAFQTSTKLMIESMLAQGELPTLSCCAHCGTTTDDTVDVTAECETVWTNEQSGLAIAIAWIFLGIWAALLPQRSEKEYGSNLILHLPVRTCRGCRRQFTENPLASNLGVVAIAFAVIAIGIMVFWSAWGGLLLIGSAITFGLATVVRKRRQQALAKLLRPEPIYSQLLDDYPDAHLVLPFDGTTSDA